MAMLTDWLGNPYVVAGLMYIVLAIAGGLLTEIGPWYKSLKFPSWKPPDWAFGPVWTTIFTLSAIAAGQSWNAATSDVMRDTILWTFGVNAVLNVAWSYLYFKLKRPDWAFIEWTALWLSVLAMVVVCFNVVTLAGWLVLPYLVWVSAAGLLNWQTVQLNKSRFGSSAA